MYSRILNFSELLLHRSIFLFGPRRTGKSTYLRVNFPDAVYYDLLNSQTYRELTSSPELIRQRLRPDEKLIIIDEIQKVPALLDEVHLMIEANKNLRFILTGSSIRKLRRGATNLLAGRALTVHFHPLVYPEVKSTVPLEKRLLLGGVPSLLDSPIPYEDMQAYVGDYLKEEIQGEFESRKLEGFSRFLDFAARASGTQINYTGIGQELGINPKVVREYFQVCHETLLGIELPPLLKTTSRKVTTTSKFYFFDIGIVNGLLKRSLTQLSQDAIGSALEHYICNELCAYRDYQKRDLEVTYWRTYSKIEVDFVLNQKIGIEVKNSSRISKKDTKALLVLDQEIDLKRKIVVCQESARRINDDGVEIMPVEVFLEELWSGKIE
jgi:predicted AAA+ superfamily ATPase